MARIAGVNIPRDKRIGIALTYIFGIGLTTAEKLLTSIKIDPNIRTQELSEEQVNQIRSVLEKEKVEGAKKCLW